MVFVDYVLSYILSIHSLGHLENLSSFQIANHLGNLRETTVYVWKLGGFGTNVGLTTTHTYYYIVCCSSFPQHMKYPQPR